VVVCLAAIEVVGGVLGGFRFDLPAYTGLAGLFVALSAAGYSLPRTPNGRSREPWFPEL
jgi:hypothetical protein